MADKTNETNENENELYFTYSPGILEWFKNNNCGMNPIIGNRFSSLESLGSC